MRVLLVTKPLAAPWNDSGKLLPRDLVNASSGRHRFHVLTPRGVGAEWPAHVTAHALYGGALGFRLGPLERLRMLAGVWGLRGRTDALHFFFQPHPAASRAARALARASGRPAIHTVSSAPASGHDVRTLVFADRVVTLSDDTARKLAPALRVPAVTIPPGLGALEPVEAERVARVRAALGLEAGFALYPGDFEFSGGHDVLLEAWASDPSLPPLVLAGRDKTPAAATARAALECGTRARNLGGRVRTLGTVPDMEALVAASACVLFPARSLYGKTDVPIVLLEAWRESRPVLTSGIAPLRELVAGLDAEVPDAPAAWAAAVRRTLAEAGARGRAGRERLLDRYTARRSAAAYESLYDDLESGLLATRPPL